MPAYFSEGDIAQSTDAPTKSLQKVVSLLGAPKVPGFALPAYDTLAIAYYGATNNVHTVVYSLAGTIVATLTLSYAGGTPSSDDATLTGVVKS